MGVRDTCHSSHSDWKLGLLFFLLFSRGFFSPSLRLAIVPFWGGAPEVDSATGEERRDNGFIFMSKQLVSKVSLSFFPSLRS